MILPGRQQPSGNWLWLVTERDHLPLSWAHSPAVRDGHDGLDAHRLRHTDQVALRAEVDRICRIEGVCVSASLCAGQYDHSLCE
jgi:hypothetical protein